MGWWTPDRTAYALNYLINAGLSPYGAAGLVSRWANVEASGGPSSVNPYSGAFGIAQWLGSRLPPIRGNTNFDAQLAYAVRELNSSEGRAANVLRTADTAWEGALGASMFERAEGYNPNTGVDNFTQRTANGVAAILGYHAHAPAAYPNETLAPAVPLPGVFDWSDYPAIDWAIDWGVGDDAAEERSEQESNGGSSGLIFGAVAVVVIISFVLNR